MKKGITKPWLKVITLLAVLSVISVGFASWLIVEPVQQSEASGSIQAATVESTGLELSLGTPLNADKTAYAQDADPTIIMGKPKTLNNNKWLYALDAVNEQNLTVYYPLTITDETGAAFGFNIKIELDALVNTQVDNSGFSYLAEYKLIAPQIRVLADVGGKPSDAEGNVLAEVNTESQEGGYELEMSESTLNGKFGNVTVNEEVKYQAKVWVEVTFAWGATFESQNPYDYYNNLGFYEEITVAERQFNTEDNRIYQKGSTTERVTVSSKVANEVAKAFLEMLNANLNETSFKLVISGEVTEVGA